MCSSHILLGPTPGPGQQLDPFLAHTGLGHLQRDIPGVPPTQAAIVPTSSGQKDKGLLSEVRMAKVECMWHVPPLGSHASPLALNQSRPESCRLSLSRVLEAVVGCHLLGRGRWLAV
jgi:hypothetical protein